MLFLRPSLVAHSYGLDVFIDGFVVVPIHSYSGVSTPEKFGLALLLKISRAVVPNSIVRYHMCTRAGCSGTIDYESDRVESARVGPGQVELDQVEPGRAEMSVRKRDGIWGDTPSWRISCPVV